MAMLWAESFDHYANEAAMLDGAWAERDVPFAFTSPGRTGERCMRMGGNANGTLRRVLGGLRDEIFVGFAVFPEGLPNSNNNVILPSIRNGANQFLAELRLQSDGTLEVFNGAGASIGRTAAPVVPSNSWTHIEVRYRSGAGDALIQVRVNETQVLDLQGQTLASSVAQLAWRGILNNVAVRFDDIVICDALGAVNNSWRGDLRVATIPVVADANTAWGRNARRRVSEGVASTTALPSSHFYTPTFALGAGDFTAETWVRFHALPTGSNRAPLMANWRENTNQRAWELALGGPNFAGGRLVWRASPNGQANSVQTIHEVALNPELFRSYHVAVVRTDGVSRLYVDGRLHSTAADPTNYPAGSRLSIFGAGDVSGTQTSAPGISLVGYLDEVRVSAVARYPGEFVPQSSRHPRGGDDPQWSSVRWLLGFEGASLADESPALRANSQGFTTFPYTSAVVPFDPDDGLANFQSVEQLRARDDTWVEAPFLPARGSLTLSALPLANETVRLGSVTYRFVAALSQANDVLIGATADASLANLAAAVNAGTGAGSVYHDSTAQNTAVFANPFPGESRLEAVARQPGQAGNAIVSTETLTNGSFGAATLQGGADIPPAQEFVLGPLPFDATGVRAAILVNRMRKSDAGAAEVRASLVTDLGGVANGAVKALTTQQSYYQDVIEIDPNTTAGLTPQTLLNAKLRLNRTV